MTLCQQFDEIMKMVSDMEAVGGEEEFIETVIGATKIKDEMEYLEEKKRCLKQVVAKKEKQVARRRMQVKLESSKLEDEKKKIEAAEREKEALERVLEEVRTVVMGSNTTNEDLLSLIDSFSLSDFSTETE